MRPSVRSGWCVVEEGISREESRDRRERRVVLGDGTGVSVEMVLSSFFNQRGKRVGSVKRNAQRDTTARRGRAGIGRCHTGNCREETTVEWRRNNQSSKQRRRR